MNEQLYYYFDMKYYRDRDSTNRYNTTRNRYATKGSTFIKS